MEEQARTMLVHQDSRRVLGTLGWRHCKDAIPKHLIEAVKLELSDLMVSLGAPNARLSTNRIDRQAKTFTDNISSFQTILQKNIHQLASVYKLALSEEIQKAIEVNTGWPSTELSPIHNIRVKFPSQYGINSFTTVPWHQDYGATDPRQSQLQLITAWIPLTHSNAHGGGIELIPRSTTLGWLEHYRGERGPEVKEEVLKNALRERSDLKPIQVNARVGDIIFFDQYTLHRSLINSSRKLRWSIDMRYIAQGTESGRPGLWPQNPTVGQFVYDEVMSLARQRQESINNPNIHIRKRVDHDSTTLSIDQSN